MKSSFFLAVAICLFSVAAALNISIYNDDDCKTTLATGLPFPNPFVINLNECKQYVDNSWLKVETCTPNAAATHKTYTDNNCTTVKTGPGSVVAALSKVGTCFFRNMATCGPTAPSPSPVSSASSTGTALFAAVSAVIVACV